MSGLGAIPEWLGTAIVGAVFAALGYVARLLHDRWQELQAARAARLASLQQLATLLDTSYRVFLTQNDHARRLMAMLAENHPGEARIGLGFEQTFWLMYDEFTPEEAELHGIIRTITTNSMLPLNQSMNEWLQKDLSFRTASVRLKKRYELAEKLRHLAVHLTLWLAKYQYWIPDNPKHALVYLADEEEHGVGFPEGLNDLANAAIRELTTGT